MHYQVRLKDIYFLGDVEICQNVDNTYQMQESKSYASLQALLTALTLLNAVLHQQLIYFLSELFWTGTTIDKRSLLQRQEYQPLLKICRPSSTFYHFY